MTDTAGLHWPVGARSQAAAGLADAFLTPLSALIFIRSAPVGVAMWVVLMQTPPLAIATFLALGGIELLRRPLQRYGIDDIATDIRANVVLGALFTGWLVTPMGLHPMAQIVFVAAGVLATFHLGMIGHGVMQGSRFPVGVLPYCLWAAMLLTLFPDAATASRAWFGWNWTGVGSARDLFAALPLSAGVFVFSPSLLSGVIILAAVLAWSPSMFIAGVLGWTSGALCSLGLVRLGVPVDWVPTSYNGFLAGMALGAVFVEPGWKSLSLIPFVGALTALIAATLQILTSHSGVSYLPVPFMLTLFAGLLTRSVVTGQDRSAPGFDRTPEQRRISSDWIRARWGGTGGPLLGLPAEGPVQVTQGVDGVLTHRGAWRHALDFQAVLPEDEEEARPTIWGRTVYSPVEGMVVSVCNNVADNAIGGLNHAENWGNHVIVRTGQGDHVALCHLVQGSVEVQPGQAVGFGTRIGRVGNSGRSSVPHLHLQAQSSARLGSPTVPFRIANYLDLPADPARQGPRWHAAGLPREGAVVAPGMSVPATHALLTGLLPGRAMWVAGPGCDLGPVSTITSITGNGLLRIDCPGEGKADFQYDVDALRVVDLDAPEDSFVAALAMGLSTVPFAAFAGLRWSDALHVPAGGPEGACRRLLSPYLGTRLTRVELTCEATGPEGLRLSARARLPGDPAPAEIEVTLVPRKGPVRLVLRRGRNVAERSVVAFEVHAT